MKKSLQEIIDFLKANDLLIDQKNISSSQFIYDIQLDSRLVRDNNLFLVFLGYATHGKLFIKDAIKNGAKCILAEEFIEVDDKAGFIRVRNIAEASAKLCQWFQGDPMKGKVSIGVTGTNGKTSTSYLIQYLIKKSNKKCGLLGSLFYDNGITSVEADRTTPDLITFYKKLAEMDHNKCDYFVMEVSSHALDQGRIGCHQFDYGILTNLTEEHLDYHDNMESYYKAKKKLFAKHMLMQGQCFINTRNNYGLRLSKEATCLTNTISELDVVYDLSGMKFEYKNMPFHIPMIGQYNFENCFQAIQVCESIGIPLIELSKNLTEFPGVPGRMQAVSNKIGAGIYIDYAHTGDALDNALSCLKKLPHNQLKVIFGCGGNRDPLKRKTMAKAAKKWADEIIITSDNPRMEDPEKILEDIEKYLDSVTYQKYIDRTTAIHTAISGLCKEDILVIAGKGHENYQEINGEKIPFSDLEVVNDALNRVQQQTI